MQRPLRIAVIGSGISGLGAAWLLSKRHDVTLYESENRPGGHSNTVDAPCGDRSIAVDTGFIVYNTRTYPNLIALFEHLGVPTAPTKMSFAVTCDGGRYEYSGSGVRGLFGQPSNLFNAAHYRMIADILRFYRHAPRLLQSPDTSLSLGAYLTSHGYSEEFVTRHILPMAAAIWSTPSSEVLAFPAAAFVRFFANHDLLQVTGRSPWRTVVGGSRTYVNTIVSAMRGRLELGAPVRTLTRTPNGVEIATTQARRLHDACVVATHADQALDLLTDPNDNERQLLGAFRYKTNSTVLHDDTSFMPRRRRLWSSWNYLAGNAPQSSALTLTYWMNRLQPLQTDRNLFVTLNPARPIDRAHAIATFDYAHPVFDASALAAQHQLWGLQGRRNTWFCGSYFGSGFHEDGLQSGLAVAEDIGGVRRPWTVPEESGRIFMHPPTRARSAHVAAE